MSRHGLNPRPSGGRARQRFDVVPVEPWMSDTAAVRERHHDRHGAFPMEECGDRDCRSMAIRLLGDTEENTDG